MGDWVWPLVVAPFAGSFVGVLVRRLPMGAGGGVGAVGVRVVWAAVGGLGVGAVGELCLVTGAVFGVWGGRLGRFIGRSRWRRLGWRFGCWVFRRMCGRTAFWGGV